MRKCFLYLVSVLLLVSACISERAKEDEKAGKKEVNESVAESGHSCISPWQYNHVIQRLWTL